LLKDFNIIDILIDTKNKKWIYLRIKNKDYFFNKELEPVEFVNFLIKLCKKYNHRTIIIYCYNLSFFFLTLLQSCPDLKKTFEITYLLENNTVYYLNLTFLKTNTTLKFKCTSKFFSFENGLFDQNYLIVEFNRFTKLDEIEIKELLLHRINLAQWNLKQLDMCITQYYKNWNKYSYSISSVSMKIFLFNFNFFNIDVKTSYIEDQIFRPAYIGGRCEVFGNTKPGNEKIFHFDFKSMYGQVMQQDFPFGDFKKIEKPLNINLPGFYQVKVISLKKHIPVLPHYCAEENRGILYTNGEFEGLYWYEELKLFEKEGGLIKEIKFALVFEKTAPIFKKFASTSIKLRNKSFFNKYVWKSILVSFYGRLGMNSKDTKTELMDEETYKKKKNELIIHNELWLANNKFGLITYQKPINTDQHLNSNVKYAAIITSKARIKLYQAFNSIKQNGGRILYCDTDSIFASFTEDVRGKQHGEIYWDPVKPDTYISEAVFASVRSYSLKFEKDWITKIAGFPRNSVPFENFYKSFYGFSASFFLLHTPQTKAFGFWEWKEEKIVALNTYDKRKFVKNKTHTIPYSKYENSYIPDPWEKTG
jgi:hypothetical protein